MSVIEIIFWALVADSLFAFLLAWTPLGTRFDAMLSFRHFMPLTRAWTLWYVILVLFIGYLIYVA